jgi:hypothetical protein
VTRREGALRIAAVVAVPVAIALALLGVDVLRVPGEVGAEDTRFEGAPLRQRSPWEDVDFLPERLSTRLLELEDDLAYRRTISLYARTDPRKVQITTPEQEALRGRVVIELANRSREDPDPRRRAQLLNLHGALTMGRYTADPRERDANLKDAIESFRTAIRLDPDHADAKVNLEFALRAAEPGQLAGVNPERGAARGRRAGSGRAGGGY